MIPYERIIQWVAGPFSIFIGATAVKATTNWNWLGSFGVSKQTAANGIAKAVVFAVSAGVTYAAHHKWLTNLPKWWSQQSLAAPLAPDKPTPVSPTPAPAATDDLEAGPSDDEILEPENLDSDQWAANRAAVPDPTGTAEPAAATDETAATDPPEDQP